MPHLLTPAASTARRMDAVIAAFRARLRDGALDTPRAPTGARPRRVAAFIGANQATGRVARPLIVPTSGPAPRLAKTAEQRPRAAWMAQATSPVRPSGRKPPAIARSGARYP